MMLSQNEQALVKHALETLLTASYASLIAIQKDVGIDDQEKKDLINYGHRTIAAVKALLERIDT